MRVKLKEMFPWKVSASISLRDNEEEQVVMTGQWHYYYSSPSVPLSPLQRGKRNKTVKGGRIGLLWNYYGRRPAGCLCVFALVSCWGQRVIQPQVTLSPLYIMQPCIKMTSTWPRVSMGTGYQEDSWLGPALNIAQCM